ncbi:DNA/RNA nuclease SfsA [Aestuariispira insulae]|uniref:Sugar fermentation stimulation protein homolog n=1 Tax=Aestuariispira insulae TaxID=1461337 RepID=A0A3D9HR76_9PROT|nr:DNA/RNA nuclease SfsA [Aestuariispira insulae]RED51992.1 sugar fermentation stimulation protein [Aestuariispira insulae]
MEFETALQPGRLIKRYKRFLADVTLPDGRLVTAHCANSGSMMGLKDEGSQVWLSPNSNPKAKLDWRWELASQGGVPVGINTSRPNAIVADAIEAGRIPELTGHDSLRREVKYGQNSRIDILLEKDGRKTYVEVKNVTLRRPDGPHPERAEFPDAVTARGAKHLNELADMVAEGHRAVMFYLVQRPDCLDFGLAEDIDPAYISAFRAARNAGVEALCYDCDVSADGIHIRKPLPIRISD